jgi:hypothetical protein
VRIVNKQLRLLTCFAIFILVAQSVSLSCGSFQIGVGNSNLVAAAVPTFTFGNTAIGTYFDQNDVNAKSASIFTSSATGTITEITAYIARATTTGNGRAAMYSVNGGSAVL